MLAALTLLLQAGAREEMMLGADENRCHKQLQPSCGSRNRLRNNFTKSPESFVQAACNRGTIEYASGGVSDKSDSPQIDLSIYKELQGRKALNPLRWIISYLEAIQLQR